MSYSKLSFKKGIVSALMVILAVILVIPQLSQAETNDLSINDVQIKPGSSGVEIILTGEGLIKPNEAQYLQNPPRMVYDFTPAILRYNAGQTKRIDINQGNLKSIAIAQFAKKPNIVRIVFYFKAEFEKYESNVGFKIEADNAILKYFTETDENSVAKPKTIQDDDYPTINRIGYVPYENGERFVLRASGELQPLIQWDEDHENLVLLFPDTGVIIPGTDVETYSVNINGKIARQMNVFTSTENSVPESTISFKFNGDRNLTHNFYPTGEMGVYHVDVASEPFIPKVDVPIDKADSPPENAVKNLETGNPFKIPVIDHDESSVSIPVVVEDEGDIKQGNYIIPKESLRKTSTSFDNDESSVSVPVTIGDEKDIKKADYVIFKESTDSTSNIDKASSNSEFSLVDNPDDAEFADGIDKIAPLFMFVLFDNEDQSSVVYMFYKSDGKLKFKRIPE